MKKLFSAFTAVLLAFCFISCAPQEFSGSSSKNEGSVSLSIDKITRTISPASGISYTNVQTWTVTFRDETASHLQKYDDIIVKYVNFNEYPSKEIRLPIGTYKIIFEGSATKSESSDNPVEVPFYGEDSVTVEKNQTVYKSVCVAPKKSDGGKGSFNFTVNISGLEKSDDLSPLFECHLIPYGETSQEPVIKSIFNEELTTLTITAKDIPSGLYKLSIVCSWIKSDSYNGQVPESKEIFYPYHDFLVEIIDGLTTTGSADITISLEESKTYYATTGTSNGNGAFASMPKNFDALLEEIDSSVSFVNIYMVDENPSIDVSRIKKGITYNIYDKNGTNVYLIYAETEQIPSVTISGGQAKLIYSGSEGTSEINCTLQKNASVLVDSLTINIQKLEYSNYYEKNPCVVIMQNSGNNNVNLLESLTALYEVKTVSTETEIQYYITPVQIAPSQTDGFVLYNNTSDTGKPALSYATLTNDSVSSLTTILLKKDSSTKIEDYCFDTSNNLYAIVYNKADTTPYSINKYTYNNGYNKDNVKKYTITDQNVYSINYIEASDAGDLYAVICDTADYADYIAKLTLQDPTEGETAGTIIFDKYISPTSWTGNDKSYYIYTFCTDGTNLYTITSISTCDESGETAATIELAKNSITGNQLSRDSGITLDSYTSGGQSSPTDVFSGYSKNLEYKDLCYIKGKLYLIVRDVEVSDDSNDSVLYSRGALCTFTVSDTGITAGEIRIGYQTEPSIISYTISTSGQAIERTAYIGDIDSKLFYGPVKFIARKEGELLIVDNGYCVDSSNVNTKNNIVKVNLNAESASIDSFIPLESGYFDYAYSGQFGVSSISINGK